MRMHGCVLWSTRENWEKTKENHGKQRKRYENQSQPRKTNEKLRKKHEKTGKLEENTEINGVLLINICQIQQTCVSKQKN